MLFMRFSSVKVGRSAIRCRWAVTSGSRQIAEVSIGRNGRCTVAPASKHLLSLEELDSISVFVHQSVLSKAQ